MDWNVGYADVPSFILCVLYHDVWGVGVRGEELFFLYLNML